MSGICDGRVVLVTGAGRGIGREHALDAGRRRPWRRLDIAIGLELDLPAHGYSAYIKEAASFTPGLDEASLLLVRDPVANGRELARVAPRHLVALLGKAPREDPATRHGRPVIPQLSETVELPPPLPYGRPLLKAS